jgi:hypothetical protein
MRGDGNAKASVDLARLLAAAAWPIGEQTGLFGVGDRIGVAIERQ